MSTSDDDLAAFLSGSQGIIALDIARELLSVRAELASLQQEHQALIARALEYNAVAECAMAACAEAKVKLISICAVLANMSADLREYLGNANETRKE